MDLKMFQTECNERIENYVHDEKLQQSSKAFIENTIRTKYSYNFSWMGRPIIQYPQDILAMQELIWQINPDLIIETGIAHGGSLIFSASMLALREYSDAISQGRVIPDPTHPISRVVGIDIDIREHNRRAIEEHPMANRIDMIQGSSTDPSVVSQVRKIARKHSKILVCLDSHHTHDHVLAELEAYAPLTSIGSYCVVFDTVIEDIPEKYPAERPWGKGNNPKSAVWEYMRILKNERRNALDGQPLAFDIDKSIESKLLITVAPDGYLKRVKKPE